MKRATLRMGDRLIFGDGSRVVEIVDVSPSGKVKVLVVAPEHVKVQSPKKDEDEPAAELALTQ